MAYVDVNSWSAEHVVLWMRGLHRTFEVVSLDQIIRSRINGKRLLLLSNEEILDLVPKINVEASHALLDGVSLLRYVHAKFNQETVQSLTLGLGILCRHLHNIMRQAELSPRLLPVSSVITTPASSTSRSRFDFTKVDSNMQINQDTKQRVSLETLDAVSLVVDQVIRIVRWIIFSGMVDRETMFNKDFITILLRGSVEMTSTGQRDQFSHLPNDIIKKTASFLTEYCEWVVRSCNDPEYIQPCSLEVVCIPKRVDEEDFGLVLTKGIPGLIQVVDIAIASPAHRSGRIGIGDEIVQVDYQTVAGWPVERVRESIMKFSKKEDMILTIKRIPSLGEVDEPNITVLKPYAIPLKRILSRNSESTHTVQDEDVSGDTTLTSAADLQLDDGPELDETGSVPTPPREPKGPVYNTRSMRNRARRGIRRRVSISGSLSDAMVDLSLAETLPIPKLEKASQSINEPNNDKNRLSRITKEALTKSISHDTAKLYLHTLSIDRKHLWLPQGSK